MTRDEVLTYCAALSGAVLDRPFAEDFDTVAARHADNRKWFALLTTVNGRAALNLKCEPDKALFWRAAYDGVTPGWHMNKTYWNTVRLDAGVRPNDLHEMIDDSYRLTAKPPKRREKND